MMNNKETKIQKTEKVGKSLVKIGWNLMKLSFLIPVFIVCLLILFAIVGSLF